jgi:hypothetical protein
MGKTLENYRIPLPKKREKIHGDKKSLMIVGRIRRLT